MTELRESAVGRLLRAAGVSGTRDSPISLREAARRTGVSHTALRKWLDPVNPERPIRHMHDSLDAVANGLGIDRIALANASQIDNGWAGVVNANDPIILRMHDLLGKLDALESQVRGLKENVSHITSMYAERIEHQ